MFVNSEAIYGTRPWIITNEGDVWFTSKGPDLYAIVDKPWKRGTSLELVLKSVRASDKTQVSILGQNSTVYEYQPGADTRPTLSQQADGLHIRTFRTQRLQDNSAWPNPAVIRLSNVIEAFTPPIVHTIAPERTNAGVVLRGDWENPGSPVTVQVGFQYRVISGEDKNSRTTAWQSVPGDTTLSFPGEFTVATHALFRDDTVYEVRAVLTHPLLTLFGEERRLTSTATRY